MSKDSPYLKICSNWNDLADATILAVKAAKVCVPEKPKTRMNVWGYLGANWIDLRFPWGSEKLVKPYEGFAVADPCSGEWVLNWWSTSRAYTCRPYDDEHVFTFEYVPAQPRKSYTAAEVDVIESAAVQRGREYFIAGNMELQKLKQDAHAAGYALAKQVTEAVLENVKKDAFERGRENARLTMRLDDGDGYARGYAKGKELAHDAGFKVGYERCGIDLGIAKDVIRRDAYDEGFKQGVAHEKGYSKHKREMSYAEGYEKGVEHGKELLATRVTKIKEEARADERSVFFAGVQAVLFKVSLLQADADADISNDVYRRAGDYERGHAAGRGWALSKAQFLLKKTFPNL